MILVFSCSKLQIKLDDTDFFGIFLRKCYQLCHQKTVLDKCEDFYNNCIVFQNSPITSLVNFFLFVHIIPDTFCKIYHSLKYMILTEHFIHSLSNILAYLSKSKCTHVIYVFICLCGAFSYHLFDYF